MSNGKQLARCSRSNIDAAADTVIEWPDTFKATTLDIARPVLAILVSRIPVADAVKLVLSHPNRRQLIAHLAIVYRHSVQDLRQTAHLVLMHEDELCKLGQEAFADEYWMIGLNGLIANRYWRRAYDLLRFASRGIEALQDLHGMPSWTADEPIGLRCSKRGNHRLVEELHASIRAAGHVPDAFHGDHPSVFTHPNPNAIPGLSLAKAIGGFDPQLGLSHIGVMVVAIAGYIGRTNAR